MEMKSRLPTCEVFCLPSEVLERILKYLLPPDIKSVASVCRRLHHLAINALLKAYDIRLDPPVNCEVVVDGDSSPEAEYFDALAALQLALFLPRIDRLAITFTGTGEFIGMARGLRRCRRLIQKFPSLREVSIDLQPITYEASPLVDWRKGDTASIYFNALLDAIGDLAELESFRVATGWHFDRKYMLEIFPSVVGLQPSTPPATVSLLGRLQAFLPRRYPSSVVASRPPLTFLIDTPILILPSSYAWTLSILSLRPITALRLHMLVAPVDWAVMLPEIAHAVPHLTDLTILGVRLQSEGLIRCVSRLRRLTTLTLDSAPNFRSGPSFRMILPAAVAPSRTRTHVPAFGRNTSFHNLTTLAARPEHLAVLFQGHRPLRALTSLCVRLELLDLNAKPTLVLMTKIRARLRKSDHKSLPLTLDVHANISPEALMCRTLDVALSQGAAWESAFGSFQHLRVRHYGVRSPVVLARWATVFRGVAHLSMADNEPLSERYVEMVAAEVRRTSPKIRTITFGEIEYYAADTGTSVGVVSGGKLGFLGLPDDVLLIVFENLGPELYALARLSRRLHLLALPIYLAHEGIPNPSEICEFRLVNHPTGADVLSALSSALFLERVKHVSCQFKPGGIISCYLNHVERLTAFLSEFPSVETVSLFLVDLGNVDGEVNDLVQQKWRVAFTGLVNVILAKSVTTLTIRGAPYLQPTPSEPPWPKAEATMQLSSLARKNSAITSFSFHPGKMLSYSGILWTFSALRCSRISVLSISVVSSFLLEVIAKELPNLPELDIVSCSELLDQELLQLLCKLPALTRLSLPYRSNILRPTSLAEPVVPVFLRLQALRASAHFIVHFLTADNPLPVLESLELHTTTTHNLPVGWSVSKLILSLEILRSMGYRGLRQAYWRSRLVGRRVQSDAYVKAARLQ
ncbi:hypothetical protein FB451DRAFT_457827 [Mycena latifolia]|nr:hypothetical protein FB451DRAFT_457827 [Mycena latifolia]